MRNGPGEDHEAFTKTENPRYRIENPESGITRVLVLSPPLASAGGIQRYTTTLIRALNEELGEQSVRYVALAEPVRHNGAGTPRLTTGSKLRFAWQALREAVGWKPDLIICTHLAVGPVARWLAGFGRRPYWIVVHGIEAWGALPYSRRSALRRAQRVIATSIFSKEQVIRRHRTDSRRISRLPCTLDDNLCNGHALRTSAESAGNGLQLRGERKCHIADGKRVVLTVARMAAAERYKGHDVVLRALPKVVTSIPNLAYLIVGDGDDRPRLEQLARELGITEYVVFIGEVSDDELAAIYRRSEVFALPARTVIDDHDPKGEGFGIVFLEAMAFGKPVIGPNCGAPAEIIHHGENGLLVDPEDPTAVAEALVSLFTHPETARKMGEAGSTLVRTHYSYGRFRERLRSLLVSIDGIQLPKGRGLCSQSIPPLLPTEEPRST